MLANTSAHKGEVHVDGSAIKKIAWTEKRVRVRRVGAVR